MVEPKHLTPTCSTLSWNWPLDPHLPARKIHGRTVEHERHVLHADQAVVGDEPPFDVIHPGVNIPLLSFPRLTREGPNLSWTAVSG